MVSSEVVENESIAVEDGPDVLENKESEVGEDQEGKKDNIVTNSDVCKNEDVCNSDNEHEKENEECSNESESSKKVEGEFIDWKRSVEDEALKNAANKASEKTDGLSAHIRDNAMQVDTDKDTNISDDSSDESSDEDTAVEYMPDGELVRKKSRGFKQLNNCKRFWKASLMVQ